MPTKVCLLSDTHDYIDQGIINQIEWADEVWHAGDIGEQALLDRLNSYKTFRAVWGNIDPGTFRNQIPELNVFSHNQVKFMMLHIGGYPPRYNKRSKLLLDEHKPDVFITGHSHILKVMRDQERNLLYLNPGAAGQHGFHKERTLLRFIIEQGSLSNLEVVKLGKRGR